MTIIQFPCGDGESDDGTGVLGMCWNVQSWIDPTTPGDIVEAPAPAQYIELPWWDTDPSVPPAYRSDTNDYNKATKINVLTSVGTTITIVPNILPCARVGNAIVTRDDDLEVRTYYVTAVASPTEFTVDRAGMGTGDIEGFFLKTPRVVTYAANTEGLPSYEKMYGQLWVNFQMLRGGQTLSMTTRRFGQPDADETTQTRDYAAELGDNLNEGVEFIARFDVPREQTRAVGLQVSVTVGDPISYFQLGAMAFEYTPTGTRTSRGV